MPKQNIRRLLGRLRSGFSGLTYYDAYVDARERLDERSAFEELGHITATLTHDLQGPMSAMNNRIYVMKQQFQHDDRMMRSLAQLEEQLERINHSLTIIPLLRGDTEYFERFMVKTEVRSLIFATIKDVKRELEMTDPIIFRVDDRNLFIKAYPRMLEQALANILKNSIEAIRESKRERGLISISLARLDDVEKVRVEIVDNGCGIPEENLSRISELFTSKKYGSVNRGLGLFTAVRIVNIHEGAIQVSSEFGKGTNVLLILPRWIDH